MMRTAPVFTRPSSRPATWCSTWYRACSAEADVRSIARSESRVMLSGGQAGLPVVQIGHMGPAAYPLGPVIGLVALGQALRRAGAAADVGAAVEAALGGDPHYPPA